MTGLSDDQGGVGVAGDRGDEMGEIDLRDQTEANVVGLTGDEGDPAAAALLCSSRAKTSRERRAFHASMFDASDSTYLPIVRSTEPVRRRIENATRFGCPAMRESQLDASLMLSFIGRLVTLQTPTRMSTEQKPDVKVRAVALRDVREDGCSTPLLI